MRKLLIIITLAALFTGLASAQTANETKQVLQEAQNQIQAMEEENIPTERVENLLETANNSYLAQKNFAAEGGTADYSRAIELTQQIAEIQDRALRVSDRISALSMRLEDLEDTSINLTQARNHLEAARNDFESQRFEDADQHISEGYTAISEAQSAQTQIESFAAAQQEAITARISRAVQYIRSNPGKVGGGSIVSLILLLFFVKEGRTYRLLKIRKRKRIKEDVLENMITSIQKEYYMKKEGSAIQFETKMDRFEEMRRDIVEDIEVIDTKLEDRWTLLWNISEHLEDEEDEEVQEQETEKKDQKQEQSSEEKSEAVEETEEEETSSEEVEESKETDSEEESGESESEESGDQEEKIEVFDPSEKDEKSESDENKHEEKVSCPVCGDKFDTERGMHIHQSQKHSSEDEEDSEGVECPICGEVFDTERGMHIHRGEVHKD